MKRRCYGLIAALLYSPLGWSLDNIELPAGFSIEEYAEVPNARSMSLGSNGTVFVSSRRSGSIYAIVSNADDRRTVELLSGLRTPNGIAFFAGDLYVAETDRVTRYRDIENHLFDVPDAEVLAIDLPSARQHGSRYIDFGPDGKLYIAVGAPCNICDRAGFANIIRMNPDGSAREEIASGVRNSVGFAWHPTTRDLWFTDNGRDMMGDDLPADELNRVTTNGEHFGYPYCHQGNLLDPKFGDNKNCADYRAPEYRLGAHVAPLGLTFYTGSMFPDAFRNQLFIAEHGSWNRSKKVGYRVSLVTFADGQAVSYEPFATGWLDKESVSGRPVDALIISDGSMLISDDYANKIYRISYKQDEQ